MKRYFKFIPVLLALLFLSCGDGLTTKVVSSYDNGQPARVFVYDKSGECIKEIDYYETGELLMEGGMQNNLRNGEWTAYFADGKVQSSGFFKDGKRTGKALVYHENGNLYMDGWYKDDHKCGQWVYYDEQGYELMTANYGDCD